MEDESTPETQPADSLVPPPKIPGTALEAVTLPRPPRRNEPEPLLRHDSLAGEIFERVLDSVDVLADGVAAGLGLR